MYKRKHPERFDAWWRPLTKQGDPSHRYDLIGEAFDAGYEAGKRAALLMLGRKLVEEYATQETSLGDRCEQCGVADGEVHYASCPYGQR